MATDTAAFAMPRRRRSPGTPAPSTRGFRFQALAVALLLALWEGVPLTLAGLSTALSIQSYTIVMLIGTGLFFVRLSRHRFTYWEALPLILLGLCTAVSTYYSMYLSPQPLPAWLTAIYALSPLLSIFALRAFGCRLDDAENALYWVGFIGSIVLLVSMFAGLSLLDPYVRGSALGTVGRVVFLKLPSTFALMIATMRLINRTRNPIRDLLVIVVTGYNVFVASESRLVMIAFLIAFVLVWLFLLRSNRRLLLALLAPVIGIPLLWFVMVRFLSSVRSFQGLDQYMAQDISASFRQKEIDFFWRHFDQTGGIGFGFMSGSPEYSNIISFATNQGGRLFGTGDYGLGLDDVGIYSAMFQYGYVGVALILVMTLLAIFSLVRLINLGRDNAPSASLGFLMAGFMFSPIAMNYFTLFYSAHIGGLLWFMAAEADAMRRRAGLGEARRTPRRALPI